MSDDLIAFVTARLGEREVYAQRLAHAYADERTWSVDGAVINAQALVDPAHVLREVAAMRAIVADAAAVPTISARRMVKHLAAIWSEHADYRAEWTR